MGLVSAPRLLWQNLASAGSYHAALVSARFRSRTELHTHDFFEMMYVLSGGGTHSVNQQLLPLRTGDLIFIRPDDCHSISTRMGTDLQFVNVAFPGDFWLTFCNLAGLSSDRLATEPLPPTVRVPVEHRDDCAAVFRRALFSFHYGAPPLELCAFWALAVPNLLQRCDPVERDDGMLPPWLRSACWAMRDDRNLQVGLLRFVELSGVSSAHLSRTLMTYRHVTPTTFINRLRLERAALLLATTTEEIGNVAADCGFRTLSHFYRLFSGRYGQSPRVYRLQAQRAIAPRMASASQVTDHTPTDLPGSSPTARRSATG